MVKASLLAAGLLCATPVAVRAQDVPAYVKGELPSLVETYKGIHAHPELSHFEANTSAMLAEGLRKAGFAVTERVGVYADGTKAYGVVGLLKNGGGPTLLVRGDMDALPIVEETGVAYASHVTTKNKAGQEVGVMHACGHDVHTTVLLGTARLLAAEKASWHGTLMIVGQPSEETADGAKAMVADHLFERFGKPDMLIGLHDSSGHAAGTVGITPGAAQASSTSVDVTVRGIGGHGAAPQAGRDPVLMAAMLIVQLQTIVSREEDPTDPAVVTVGSIQGGTKRNIIPDEVKLELTTRAFSDKGRQTIVDGIRQMAKGVADSYGLPPDRQPIVTVLENESTPVTYNDPALTAKVRAVLVKSLGEENVFDDKPFMPSEDVGVYGQAAHAPLCYFWLGAMDPAKFAAAQAEGKALPGPHTSKFEPLPEPTIQTGVIALSSAAMALLQ